MGEDKMVMPVAPMYGGNYGGGNGLFGNGGDSWLGILFLIALLNGGMWGGFGGMGGYGMMMNGMWGMDGLYPWLNNSQNINGGFRDQMINSSINGIQNSITSGFGDVQTALCGGFAGVNQNISNSTAALQNSLCNGFNGVSQQLANNEINNIERSFAAQTAVSNGMNSIAMNLQNCCCENRANIADLKYTVATENCADRTQAMQNTRDIIDAQTRGTQAILDKLCALELDGVKGQLAQAQRENVGLQNQLNMAALRESQTAQNAFISQGFANEVDQLYNRLKNCPVGTTPVYGNTPIFTCPNQFNTCGCGA